MLFNRTACGFIVGFVSVIAISFAVMIVAGKRAAEHEAHVRAASELERGR